MTVMAVEQRIVRLRRHESTSSNVTCTSGNVVNLLCKLYVVWTMTLWSTISARLLSPYRTPSSSLSPYGTECHNDTALWFFSHESRLINCLLERYSRVTTFARPVENASSSVVVDFTITLIQILDFDEIKQILTTSMWKNYVWDDQVLRWDPEKFGGVTQIRLPASEIWTPDIVLYNKCEMSHCPSSDSSVRLPGPDISSCAAGSRNADDQIKQHEELAAVYFNGTIKWIPPAIYRSSCEINMANFPFDMQTCFFKFGSWTYDQHKVDLRLLNSVLDIDMREYLQSSEWDVVNTSAIRYVRRYPFFETDPYPELLFMITMKRQSTFYIYLLVLPCILLSALTLVLFWIPPQRPDRTAVGMSLFSSFFILLLILVQSSPPTSASISRLGINYCINMVLIAVSTILSVLIINLGHPGPVSELPRWITVKRLNKLSRYLCIQQISRKAEYLDDHKENGIYMDCLTNRDTRSNFTYKRSPGVPSNKNTNTATWNTLAAILDRIFFLLYLLVVLLSTVFIFPR